MISDNEDIAIRVQGTTGAIDEFYQATLQNNCARCKSTSSCAIVITPKYLDSISQDGITVETGSDTVVSTLPKKTEWMATKVFTSDSESGTVAMNLNQEYLGFKSYIYDPYNTNVTSETYPIGKFQFTYSWSFKDADNRALITILTLNNLSQAEQVQKRKLELLKHPGGWVYETRNKCPFKFTQAINNKRKLLMPESDQPKNIPSTQSDRQTPILARPLPSLSSRRQ